MSKHGIRLRRRKLVCENKVFRVFFDHIEAASGLSVPDYLVLAPKIRSRGGITGVAILPVEGKTVGLIRIYRHAIQAFSWEIPRGFMDPRENSRAAAARELVEEMGLECPPSRMKPLGCLDP